MAAFVELIIDQGTTFNNIINITDDITNASVNIANYTITSKLKKSYYSANATASLVCTVTDAANGEITLFLSAANTANIPAGRYIFDVKIVNAQQSVVSRALEGIIQVTPQVTT